MRGLPLTPTPLPEGRGAFGLVVWGGTAMSWHRGRRWRSCLVVSPAVVWRCGWVMRLLGSQRGSAAAWGFRGLFLCSASPIVKGSWFGARGNSYAAAPRTSPVLAWGIRTRLRHVLLWCWLGGFVRGYATDCSGAGVRGAAAGLPGGRLAQTVCAACVLVVVGVAVLRFVAAPRCGCLERRSVIAFAVSLKLASSLFGTQFRWHTGLQSALRSRVLHRVFQNASRQWI